MTNFITPLSRKTAAAAAAATAAAAVAAAAATAAAAETAAETAAEAAAEAAAVAAPAAAAAAAATAATAAAAAAAAVLLGATGWQQRGAHLGRNGAEGPNKQRAGADVERGSVEEVITRPEVGHGRMSGGLEELIGCGLCTYVETRAHCHSSISFFVTTGIVHTSINENGEG